MTDARDALSVWDALKPKIEQLIADKTQTAVRQKKMNITRIDTSAKTVTVYDGINSSRSITIPYVPGVGIDLLSSGYSVLVEWRDNDISTAVAVAPGQGWASSVGDLPGATLPYATLSNPVLSGNVDVSGASINFFGDVLYTNSDPTQTMASGTGLVSGVNVLTRPYNLFLFEFCYSTDYTNTRNSVSLYIPTLSGAVDLYAQCSVVWYGPSAIAASWRQIHVYKTTSGTDTFWTMMAGPGYLATVSGNTNYTKYCIPLRIIGMHI